MSSINPTPENVNRDLAEISIAATSEAPQKQRKPKKRYIAFTRGNAETMQKAAEALRALNAGTPLSEVELPPGMVLEPTREFINEVCRELGVEPPPSPLPKGGWHGKIFNSVRMISGVWKYSKTRFNELLIMLALADFANDAEQAWPSVETLAKKARLSERATQYVLGRLERSGELIIERGKGPRGCNLYTLKLTEPGGAHCCTPKSAEGGAHCCTRGGADTRILGVHTAAPEPSINRHLNRHMQRNEVDSNFIAQQQANFTHLDVEQEFGKAKAWISTRPNRRMTRRFFVGWLNRAEPPPPAPEKEPW